MARIIDSPAMNLVGSRVRALRLERKMSQQTLSNKPETLATSAAAPYPESKTNGAR